MRPHRSSFLLLAAVSLAACGEGSPTAVRAAADAPVLAARGAAVDGSYLVVLAEGADPRSVADRLLYKAAL